MNTDIRKLSYLRAEVTSNSTAHVCEFMRILPLDKVQQVVATPIGYGYAKIMFYFDMGHNQGFQVNVIHAFNVGERNERSAGLYTILREAGFSEKKASKVFEAQTTCTTTINKGDANLQVSWNWD